MKTSTDEISKINSLLEIAKLLFENKKKDSLVKIAKMEVILTKLNNFLLSTHSHVFSRATVAVKKVIEYLKELRAAVLQLAY
jgi:hypothetical protein